LGNFVGATLSASSALGCLLERRSAHTHTMLTNGPLLLASVLAVWVVWERGRGAPSSVGSDGTARERGGRPTRG